MLRRCHVSRLAHGTPARNSGSLGDAGDELFAGYDWYRARRGPQRPSTASQRLCPSTERLCDKHSAQNQEEGLLNITRRFLEVATLPKEMQHTRWQIFWRDDELANLLTIPEHERSSVVDPRLLALFAASGSAHSLDQQQYVDLKRYLPDDILFKVDRMSMAVSLETRGRLWTIRLSNSQHASSISAPTWVIDKISSQTGNGTSSLSRYCVALSLASTFLIKTG